MIGVIAKRELRSLYATPIAWLLLAGVQLILSWLLFTQLEVYQTIQPELVAKGSLLGVGDLVISPTLSSAILMLLVITPLLGMRSLSDEVRSGRISLLLSSPVSARQLVIGKWLGLLLAISPVIMLTMLMALTIGLASAVDSGRLLSSGLALTMVCALAAAVSIWSSSITSQSAVAATIAYALLLLLWVLDSKPDSSLYWLSMTPHTSPLLDGILDSRSLIYFFSLTALVLVLSTHKIWRLGGGRG